MFETSRDVLNILIGFSALILAVTVSVLLYNLIMIIRDFRILSKSIKEKVALIDGLIKTSQSVLSTIQEKLEHSSAYFGILIELVNKIIEHMKNKKQNNEITDKSQTSDND